jgi:hypothetical protein
LPTPTIGATSATQAGKYFNTVLYTGNGATQTISGVGFQPDWVWLKNRGSAGDNGLYDVLRGTTNRLVSNSTNAADTISGVTAFNSDGFSLGADYNGSSATFVAWNWNAGGSTVTNTTGSISSQVRASTTSGFSIVTYTGTGANATIGHGLGKTPAMIICKNRTNNATFWHTYVAAISGMQSAYITLNTTGALYSPYSNVWNNTQPTSSVFSVGDDAGVNGSGTAQVAYCFAEIAGYSKFGSYTGNGSSSGPFVFTNMQVAYVMIKCTDTAGTDWAIYDNKRNTYNVVNTTLEANLTLADYTSTNLLGIDFLSNGFRLIGTDNGVNGSGKNYIFMAFSQNPFKYSLAR